MENIQKKKFEEELKYQTDRYGDKSRLKCNLEILELLKEIMITASDLRFWQMLLILKDHKSDFNLILEESFETKESFQKFFKERV